ncbi:MAG: methyltransferase domain-containing protein [Thermogemmata sp.]
MLLRVVEMFDQPGTFLEVGCEGGRWSVLLSQRGWRAVCTDINKESLRVCQERLPEARCVLVKEKDTTLPCKSAEVRLVLCIEVIAVLRSDWFICEASRVLESDGVLMGVFLNRHSLRGYLHHLLATVRGQFDWYERSYLDWKRSAREKGFEFLYEEGFCWFPIRRSSNSVLVQPAVALEQALGLRRLTSVSPWIVFIARKRCA